MVQHYTSNPLLPYTGKLDTPLVKISYLLRDGQHIGLSVLQSSRLVFFRPDIYVLSLSLLLSSYAFILSSLSQSLPEAPNISLSLTASSL